MELQGKVRGFGRYTKQQLEQMKADLDISMPLSALSFCANYYRTQQRRDPAIDELKMIDRFYHIQTPSLNRAMLTELYTNNAFTADTYADLLSKRRTLDPYAKSPCSLRDLTGIANAYLKRAGKSSANLPSAVLLPTERGKEKTDTNGLQSMAVAKSGYRLLFPKETCAPKALGDLLVILLPSAKTGAAKYEQTVTAFFYREASVNKIKQTEIIADGGLLEILPSFSCGLWIEYFRLSRTGEPIPLNMLTEAYEGKYVVRISRNECDTFCKEAAAAGLCANAFASVIPEASYTFVRESGETFSLDFSFLAAMRPLRRITAKLQNEVFQEQTSTPIQTAKTALVKGDNGRDILCAASACMPHDAVFLHSLDCLLTPVLNLAAAGCDYISEALAVAVELPRDTLSSETAVGESIAVLLAVYRIQAELSMLLSASSLCINEKLEHPQLTAFVTADASAPCSAIYTQEGNRVYCIVPERTADGMLNFSALRTLLDFLCRLRRDGALYSARVLCRESVTDAIREMSRGALFCCITGDALVAEGTFPLAIMIETDRQLPAKQVGFVAKKQPPPVLS